jgi:hypothetical protein
MARCSSGCILTSIFLSRKTFGIGHKNIHNFLLTITDTKTSQYTDLSSWDTLYTWWWSYVREGDICKCRLLGSIMRIVPISQLPSSRSVVFPSHSYVGVCHIGFLQEFPLYFLDHFPSPSVEPFSLSLLISETFHSLPSLFPETGTISFLAVSYEEIQRFRSVYCFVRNECTKYRENIITLQQLNIRISLAYIFLIT